MSWERYDDSGTRWRWTADDERHLLVLHDGELREYHEVPDGTPTVHVYEPGGVQFLGPLQDAEHLRTFTVADNFAPWVRALDDFELIEWLMGAKYVDAT